MSDPRSIAISEGGYIELTSVWLSASNCIPMRPSSGQHELSGCYM